MKQEEKLINFKEHYQPLNIEKEINQFHRLHDILKKMPNNKEKYQILQNYIIYYAFLSKIIGESSFPFKIYDFDWQTVDNKYLKYYQQLSSQLINTRPQITKLFTDIRNINESYGIYQEFELTEYINPKLGHQLLQEFFNLLPINFQNIFCNILNGNLYLSNDGLGGFAYNLDYTTNSKVSIDNDFNNYDTYWGLAHEIGHIYHYHLLNGRKIWPSFDDEVPGIFLEIIFQTFTDKFLGNSTYGINSMFSRQTLFASLLAFEEMILTKSDEIILDNDELTGYLELCNLNNRDYQQLLKSPYKNQLNKENSSVILTRPLSSYKYIISNLIAIVLADIYHQDQKEGLRILRDYLSLPPNVTFKEKLAMFDLVGNSYHKTIKKVSNYGIKKHILTK